LPPEIAVLALKTYALFLEPRATAAADTAAAIVAASREFDAD